MTQWWWWFPDYQGGFTIVVLGKKYSRGIIIFRGKGNDEGGFPLLMLMGAGSHFSSGAHPAARRYPDMAWAPQTSSYQPWEGGSLPGQLQVAFRNIRNQWGCLVVDLCWWHEWFTILGDYHRSIRDCNGFCWMFMMLYDADSGLECLLNADGSWEIHKQPITFINYKPSITDLF